MSINNKPKYTLFKNTSYAIDGFIYAFKTETSFKLELFLGIPIVVAIFLIDITISSKLILIATAFLIPIVELLNSSIENLVDLVTSEFHPLAKSAKDIGATAVLFSVVLHVICWIIVIFL